MAEHPPAVVAAVVDALSAPTGAGYARSMNVAMTAAVARRILDAVAPLIRAGERERIAADLEHRADELVSGQPTGDDHIAAVAFTDAAGIVRRQT